MFFKIFFGILVNVIIVIEKGLSVNKVECKEKLCLEDILSLFETGCKPEITHKVGIEYERLPISVEDFTNVDYSAENGVYEFLRAFAKSENWDYITDDYHIIGLKQNHDTITLEPGCQIELSLEPERNICDIENKIDSLNKKFAPILNKFGMMLLNYGVSPISTYKNINLMPKKRYGVMANYLWGILSDVMMRETAGIQACFDFESEEDAMRKFRVSNMLTPFMTAMFANSPIRGGVETGYKTFRALSWLNTDNERCGFGGKFKEETSFKDYINCVLDTPMIFINRGGKTIEINGKITFKQFMNEGYEGFEATIEDFKLHANLYFPEVRLRKFIEIRNHDCVNSGMQYSIMAIYKGILYNSDAMDEVEKMFSKLSHNDFAEFRYNVPKNALETHIKNHYAKDFAKEILRIAENSLKQDGIDEEKYLEPIKQFTNYGLSPADVIISNWKGTWNKDVNKLIKHLSN